MRKTQVVSQLIEIYRNLFKNDPDVTEHLLGNVNKRNYRDLLYYLLTIEDTFHVKIPSCFFESGDFSSISKIADIMMDLNNDA